MKFLENLRSARELSRKICLVHYKRVKFLQLAFSHIYLYMIRPRVGMCNRNCEKTGFLSKKFSRGNIYDRRTWPLLIHALLF